MAAHAEIDSFVKKFKSLWNAGFHATLNLESMLGEVNVSLNCKVGRVVPPPSSPSMFSVSSPRYRSPSYFRRQARRKAARESQNLQMENHAADQVIDMNTDETTSIEKVDNEFADVVEEYAAREGSKEEIVTDEVTDIAEIEVDEEEMKKDKVIEEVLISSVTKPMEKMETVEEEIRQKFAEIGVNVLEMKTFSNNRGCFDQSRVRTTPVNLKNIWGRRLGLKNCSVIEYFPPPPGWKPPT